MAGAAVGDEAVAGSRRDPENGGPSRDASNVLRCWNMARRLAGQGRLRGRFGERSDDVLLQVVQAVAGRPNSQTADDAALRRMLLGEYERRTAVAPAQNQRRITTGPGKEGGGEPEKPDACRPLSGRGAERATSSALAQTASILDAVREPTELAARQYLRALRGGAADAAAIRPGQLPVREDVLHTLRCKLGGQEREAFFRMCDDGYPPAQDLLEQICVAITKNDADGVAILASQVSQLPDEHRGATPLLDPLGRGEGTPWSPAAAPRALEAPALGYQVGREHMQVRKSVPRRRAPRDSIATSLGDYTHFSRWVHYGHLIADARLAAEALYHDLRVLCPDRNDIKGVTSEIRNWAVRGRSSIMALSLVARRVWVRALAVAASVPTRFVCEPPLHGRWWGSGSRRCSSVRPEILCGTVSATAALRSSAPAPDGQFGEALVANVALLVRGLDLPVSAEVLADQHLDVAYSRHGSKDAAAQFAGVIYNRSICSVRERKFTPAHRDSISVPRWLLDVRYVERLVSWALSEAMEGAAWPVAGVGSCISELAPQSH